MHSSTIRLKALYSLFDWNISITTGESSSIITLGQLMSMLMLLHIIRSLDSLVLVFQPTKTILSITQQHPTRSYHIYHCLSTSSPQAQPCWSQHANFVKSRTLDLPLLTLYQLMGFVFFFFGLCAFEHMDCFEQIKIE